jgi:hypothetical protein
MKPVPPTPVVPTPAPPKQPELPLSEPDSRTYNPETTFLQPKLTGYRQLSPNEAELINDIKRDGEKVGLTITALESDSSIDQRWLAIAKTDLQKGFMALVRAVAQPTSF